MKRLITYLLILAFCGSIILMFYLQSTKSPSQISGDGTNWMIRYKGLKNARDFVFDNDGNCYIAYKEKVQLIDQYGRSYILFENKDLNINTIAFKNDVLYYSSGTYVYGYYIKSKEHKELITNLPNFGDYKDSRIFIKDDIVYITIGSATNSGIVGEDNKWIKDNPFFHDMTPKNLTISANISKKQATGAFVPYNSKNIPGQIIPSKTPGNSSVLAYNLKNGSSWLYAWGIRNINGIDYNSEGRFFISVGGMEDRGARAIKGDSDYIFEMKENIWYGWPDYSGGDPVTSPKFKGGNNGRVSFILDKHPTTNPPAPLYQHKNLSSIKSLAVDRAGIFGEKDSIYFYDSKDNIIYAVTKNGLVKEAYKLKSDSNLVSMKYTDSKFYILDSNKGYLAFAEAASVPKDKGFVKNIYYYILGVIVVIIFTVIWKFKN